MLDSRLSLLTMLASPAWRRRLHPSTRLVATSGGFGGASARLAQRVGSRVLAAALALVYSAGLAACGAESGSGDGVEGGDADVASGDDGTDSDATGHPDTGEHADTGPPPLPDAFEPTAAMFTCLTEWPRVRGFHMTNVLGRTAEAVTAAEEGFERAVPPGTIIQLIPQEAMVKRLPGFAPEIGDWEFFALDTTDGSTRILERGGAEIENAAGSCAGCHVTASDRDFVCEQEGLCAAAALPRSIIDVLVESDARCP